MQSKSIDSLYIHRFSGNPAWRLFRVLAGAKVNCAMRSDPHTPFCA